MPTDNAQLQRLHRLERVRAIAKRALAAEAAAAENTLAKLQQLTMRTEQLARDHGTAAACYDGYALIHHSCFSAGLHGIIAATCDNAANARELANRKQQELASAERRRAAVESRADSAARRLVQRDAVIPLGQRRGFGTGLE